MMIRRSFVFTAFAPFAAQAGEVEFIGTPMIRVDADENEVKRTTINEAGGRKYQCRVEKKGRKYIWASRGDRELIRSDAGDWTYYISPQGSGYVKVFSGTGLAYDYVEHVTGELTTVTYWGKRS